MQRPSVREPMRRMWISILRPVVTLPVRHLIDGGAEGNGEYPHSSGTVFYLPRECAVADTTNLLLQLAFAMIVFGVAAKEVGKT